MKTLALFLVTVCLAWQTFSKRIWYNRVLTCEMNNTIKCTKWQQTSVLMYRKQYTTFCFSENTHVLTADGPKSMHQLSIQDEVFGLDAQSGKPIFSKVVAWLHRDTQGIAEYDTINTEGSIAFQASEFHNVAFVNKEGKIQYRFAGDLKEGDQLVGFPQSNPVISRVSRLYYKRGLYSPFTESGNFFIFDTAFKAQKYQKDAPMILVHVLSQVSDPSGEFWKAQAIVSLWEGLGWNYQPQDSEIYIHPLTQSLNFIFGSHWAPVLQQVKYYLPGFELSHPEREVHEQRKPSSRSSPKPSYHPSSYSSSSYSYSSPYRSSSSGLSTAGAGSGFLLGAAGGGLLASSSRYSSSHAKKQKEEDDKTSAMVLALSVMQEVILL